MVNRVGKKTQAFNFWPGPYNKGTSVLGQRKRCREKVVRLMRLPTLDRAEMRKSALHRLLVASQKQPNTVGPGASVMQRSGRQFQRGCSRGEGKKEILEEK